MSDIDGGMIEVKIGDIIQAGPEYPEEPLVVGGMDHERDSFTVKVMVEADQLFPGITIRGPVRVIGSMSLEQIVEYSGNYNQAQGLPLSDEEKVAMLERMRAQKALGPLLRPLLPGD